MITTHFKTIVITITFVLSFHDFYILCVALTLTTVLSDALMDFASDLFIYL